MKWMVPKATALAVVFLLMTGVQTRGEGAPRDRAWEIIRASAAEKNYEKRAAAVRVLALLPGETQAQEIAEKAAVDDKPDVRAAAATALGEIQGPASVEILHKLLTDKDPSVVIAAASALHPSKDAGSYEAYYEFLTGERKTGGGMVDTQMKTFKDPKKLAEFGVEQGMGFVPFAGGAAVTIYTMMRTDDVSPVRAVAAKMLTNDPDPASGKALVKATTDKSWLVRAAALEAIAKRGDAQLLDSIIPSMKDANTAVKCTGAAAVIRLSSIEGKPSPAAK
jgi:HEAT repeat protein